MSVAGDGPTLAVKVHEQRPTRLCVSEVLPFPASRTFVGSLFVSSSPRHPAGEVVVVPWKVFGPGGFTRYFRVVILDVGLSVGPATEVPVYQLCQCVPDPTRPSAGGLFYRDRSRDLGHLRRNIPFFHSHKRPH